MTVVGRLLPRGGVKPRLVYGKEAKAIIDKRRAELGLTDREISLPTESKRVGGAEAMAILDQKLDEHFGPVVEEDGVLQNNDLGVHMKADELSGGSYVSEGVRGLK